MNKMVKMQREKKSFCDSSNAKLCVTMGIVITYIITFKLTYSQQTSGFCINLSENTKKLFYQYFDRELIQSSLINNILEVFLRKVYFKTQ